MDRKESRVQESRKRTIERLEVQSISRVMTSYIAVEKVSGSIHGTHAEIEALQTALSEENAQIDPGSTCGPLCIQIVRVQKID
jgi:hypothetical protein